MCAELTHAGSLRRRHGAEAPQASFQKDHQARPPLSSDSGHGRRAGLPVGRLASRWCRRAPHRGRSVPPLQRDSAWAFPPLWPAGPDSVYPAPVPSLLLGLSPRTLPSSSSSDTPSSSGLRALCCLGLRCTALPPPTFAQLPPLSLPSSASWSPQQEAVTGHLKYFFLQSLLGPSG